MFQGIWVDYSVILYSRQTRQLYIADFALNVQLTAMVYDGCLRGSAVKRRSLAGKLSLSCDRPVAEG